MLGAGGVVALDPSLLAVRTTMAAARTRLPLAHAPDESWVYLVEEGLLRPVAITPDGREFVLGLLGPGEVFLHHEPTGQPGIGFYVEAVEDTRCLALARSSLGALAERDPALAARLLPAFAQRVADLSEACASLALDAVAERLLRLLRRLAERHGAPEGGVCRLRLRQQDVAAMVGVCRETANAALQSLAARGQLRCGRQTIWVRTAAGSLRRLRP